MIQVQFGIFILEPSDIPYSLNQFHGWDFFCHFIEKNGSTISSYYNYSIGHIFEVYVG